MYKEFLVTGSSGFIGSNFLSLLEKNKNSFWSIDQKKNPYKKIKNFSKIDLNDSKKVKNFFKNKNFNFIVHFVAMSGIIDCDKNPEKAIYDNLISTLNILKNEKKFKKIILISSYSTLDEDSFSVYSGCKKIIEQIHNTYLAKNKIITVRLPNIYGKYSLHKSSLIGEICKSIIKKKTFFIHGTGNQRRNYVFVDDLCRIISTICFKKNLNKKKLINIGNKKNYSINQILKIFEKINKRKVKIKKISHPLDVKFTKTKKIIKKPDFFIRDKSFEQNIKETLNWYKKLK